MKAKYIIVIVIAVIAIASFLKIGYLISPGSYPESENYIVNTPQKSLISKIDSVKSLDARYKIPALVNGYDSIRHSYNIYIYNYRKNQIIHLEIQPKSHNQSILHFIGVNQGLTLGNWRTLNIDIDSNESKIILTDFEQNILNKLNTTYKKE